MTGVRPTAHIWPGRQAMAEALSALAQDAPGGLLLPEPGFTMDNFVPALFEALAGTDAPEQISDLAGALLVQRLLAEGNRQPGVFMGLRAGWKLPRRLWRLLVELKAGGLAPADLLDLGLADLAELLGRYNLALAELGLADLADGLAALIAAIRQRRPPAEVERWGGVVVHDVLWLRTLDMRLLRELAALMPVTVDFCLTPGLNPGSRVAALLAHTADYLEKGGGNLRVGWQDMAGEGGPLAGLALALLGGGPPGDCGAAVELTRAAGRYGEVEELARRAADLTQKGVDPSRIAMVFPDLEIYGQMALDVAARLGLPLDYRGEQPLTASPLVRAMLALLELPTAGYPRRLLSGVWLSPYTGPALAALFDLPWPSDAEGLLLAAGYVDARETPIDKSLQAARHVDQVRMANLTQACGRLVDLLSPLGGPQGLQDFVINIEQLIDKLKLEHELFSAGGGPELLVRDISALHALRGGLAQLRAAAESVRLNQSLPPGRLLSLTRQALRQQAGPGPRGQRGGVRLLRIDQAMGLRLHTVLVGGLSLGQFPQKPQSQGMLSSQDRLRLGQRAGLPVWRTDEEEYGGQMLRLAWLIGNASHGAVLACAAADGLGNAQEPAFVLREAARLLGRPLPEPQGGVYGQTPELAGARDVSGLVAGLAGCLLRRKRQDQAALGQAALYWLAADAGLAPRWRRLAALSVMERQRQGLDLLAADQRHGAADQFSGRFVSAAAKGLLADLLADQGRRRLSPSQLEAMAACPMAWFFGWLLGVDVADQPSLDLAGRDEGEMVHRVLAAFFAPEQFDPGWSQDERRQRLSACLDQVWRGLGGGHGFVRQARGKAVGKLLAAVVERQWPSFADGLRPMAVERSIEDSALGLTVDDGPPIVLTGRLDRLDQGQGGRLLRVVDYKHSANDKVYKAQAKMDKWFVDVFQLPLYMAASARLFPVDQVAGQIVCTKRPGHDEIAVVLAGDDQVFAQDPELRQRMAEAGQANLYNALAALWSAVNQGHLVAKPSKNACEFCQMGPLCRARVNPAAGNQGDES